VLIALHDENLTRTTNISTIYPEMAKVAVSDFTLEELLKLDAGSWFNEKNPEQAQIEFSAMAPVVAISSIPLYFDNSGKSVNSPNLISPAYIGGYQGVLVLEDVMRIAQGYRIAKRENGERLYEKLTKNGKTEYVFYYVQDSEYSGHKPGIYIETKEPGLFPEIEKDLFNELTRLGWNNITHPVSDTLVRKDGKVNVGETSARIMLQTFSPESLKKLNKLFHGKIPTTFLLWLGDYKLVENNITYYFENLKWAKDHGAHIIGPSISGEPNNYADLLNDENYRWIRSRNFLIHPYSFDSNWQMIQYGSRCDGMFTNRADLTLEYYRNQAPR
jgi:glycerophosphoryl diester phosphodiesterase